MARRTTEPRRERNLWRGLVFTYGLLPVVAVWAAGIRLMVWLILTPVGVPAKRIDSISAIIWVTLAFCGTRVIERCYYDRPIWFKCVWPLVGLWNVVQEARRRTRSPR